MPVSRYWPTSLIARSFLRQRGRGGLGVADNVFACSDRDSLLKKASKGSKDLLENPPAPTYCGRKSLNYIYTMVGSFFFRFFCLLAIAFLVQKRVVTQGMLCILYNV